MHYSPDRPPDVLETRDEQYRLLFELASDAIFVGLPDGTLTAVNPAACTLLGYTTEELLAMNARDLVAPEWRDVVNRHAERKLHGLEREAQYEMAFVDRHGTRIPVETRSTVLSVGGEIVGMHAVVRDIRDRRRVQAALTESEQRFQSAFDAPLVGMALAALDGQLLRVNPALCQTLGYDEHDLLELRLRDITHPEDAKKTDALNLALLTGHTSTYQTRPRLRHLDRRYVPVHLSVSIFRDIGGHPAYTITQVIQLEHDSADSDTAGRPCPLTERERQVLSHLAKGDSTAETAAALSIGHDTVHTYVRRATRKLGARTRVHAIVKAAGAGWLSIPTSAPRGLT